MSNRGRAKRDVEFLHPGANAPGVNSKIKKKKKMSKNSEFFCGILIQMFVVHVKFHREITLVEGVVKKQNRCSENVTYKSILEL